MLSCFRLVYLATPYSRYPDGLEAAFVDAAKLAARLLNAGVRVYSPICHGHPLSVHGELDALDHSIWLPFDEAMMSVSDALAVAMMPSWKKSKGIQYEIDYFDLARKPVFYLEPGTLEVLSKD